MRVGAVDLRVATVFGNQLGLETGAPSPLFLTHRQGRDATDVRSLHLRRLALHMLGVAGDSIITHRLGMVFPLHHYLLVPRPRVGKGPVKTTRILSSHTTRAGIPGWTKWTPNGLGQHKGKNRL